MHRWRSIICCDCQKKSGLAQRKLGQLWYSILTEDWYGCFLRWVTQKAAQTRVFWSPPSVGNLHIRVWIDNKHVFHQMLHPKLCFQDVDGCCTSRFWYTSHFYELVTSRNYLWLVMILQVVGGRSTPLKNMKVSWDDDIRNWMEK